MQRIKWFWQCSWICICCAYQKSVGGNCHGEGLTVSLDIVFFLQMFVFYGVWLHWVEVFSLYTK